MTVCCAVPNPQFTASYFLYQCCIEVEQKRILKLVNIDLFGLPNCFVKVHKEDYNREYHGSIEIENNSKLSSKSCIQEIPRTLVVFEAKTLS